MDKTYFVSVLAYDKGGISNNYCTTGRNWAANSVLNSWQKHLDIAFDFRGLRRECQAKADFSIMIKHEDYPPHVVNFRNK